MEPRPNNRERGDRPAKRGGKPREDASNRVDDGIKTKTVCTNRVSKTVKGGRNMRFSVLVVAGDGNGSVGYGMGKAAEVPEAAKKAEQAARKNMRKIALSEYTIPHGIVGNFGASKVYLRPAPEGTGVIAGGSARAVLELAGIKNVTTKSYGSRNQINTVKATIDGLYALRSPESVAALRGKTVEEILG
jgi:small subunit ribosomal protein S5